MTGTRNGKRCHAARRAIVVFLFGLLAVPICAGPQSDYPMGMVGGRMRLKEGSKDVLVITSLTPNAPGARARLAVGDEIVSVNDKKFTDGYMMPFRIFGAALVEAEAGNGQLVLGIRRKDKSSSVTVRLPKSTFSDTYPFECKKTQLIYGQVCESLKKNVEKNGLRGGPVTTALGAMALLGQKTGRYDAVVKPVALKLAKQHAAGSSETSVWLISYHGIMLCEYFLLYPDPQVQKGIEAIAKRLAGSIPDHGRYGHHLRNPVNAVAYDGKGLNATTTAALWFYASAARCGIDVSLFKESCLKALARVRKETNKHGGVGYSWPSDHQSCMRSGHMGLAMHHLLLTEGLVDSTDKALIEYDRQVGTWPSRHPEVLLEAHAVSSMGIATSTASLLAHDRDLYVQLMKKWQWWLALSWEPADDASSKIRLQAAYVGGPNNTGGDFYLNGHRDLTKGFNTIMHATVGFMLASTHKRLSFYGGALPIPGLTAVSLKDRSLKSAYDAARAEKYALSVRTCDAILRRGERAGKANLKLAKAIREYVVGKGFDPETGTAPNTAKPRSAKQVLPPGVVKEFIPRFGRKLNEILKKGKKIDVYLSDLASKPTRYQLQQANESAVTVRSGTNLLPVPWRLLSAKDRAGLAKSMAGKPSKDDDAEVLMIAAVFHAAAGLTNEARDFLDRASAKVPEAAKELRAKLGLK